jgi:hypothetical protein
LKYNEFMKEIEKHLEFEKNLVTELSDLGIHTESQFKVPGTDLFLDLYIKTPIRGLIEIKAGSIDLSEIDKRIEEFKEIHSKFNKSIWMFVVFFGSDKNIQTLENRFTQLPFQFIHVPENIENQHIYCAKQIRRHIVQIALGLKQNEINIRRKEKKEIINSIENAKRHQELLTRENEKNFNEYKYLHKKLDQLKESGDDIKKILMATEELAMLRHTSSRNEKSILTLELQLNNSKKSLIKIESEILSLDHQIRDLEEENDKNLKSNSSITPQMTRSKLKIAQLSEEQAKNLESTVFTSDGSFNILNIYEVGGEKFKHFFPHLKKWSLPMQLLETDKGWFVDATNKNHGATEWKAQQYHNCRVKNIYGGELKPLWLQKDSVFLREPIQVGMFKDVLPSFKASLDPEKYALLEKEVLDFEEEYQSKHYTTAALRIGRTLEFVVYTLVKSWGVDTSVTSTSRIDKLDSSYDSLREKLITFYSDKDFYLDEEELEKAKNSLYKAISHVSNSLTEISGNLEKDEVYTTQRPLKIHALINSVRKEKIKQTEIREAIEDLINSKLIKKTYDSRNQAAHANHTGLKKDFNKEDVKLMAEDLKEILFKLSNINATIIQSSVEK